MHFARVVKTLITGFLSLAAFGAAAAPDGPYLRSEFANGALSNVIFVFKKGQVAINPKGDLDKVDFAAIKAQSPKQVGTYSSSGDTLSIAWGDGSKWEGKMKPDRAGGFDWRSSPYAPLKPLARSAKLEGRFSGGASYGGMSTAFSYVFNADGSYTNASASTVSSKTAKSTVSGGASGGAKGRYGISGTTLTLTPEGGEAKKYNAYYVPTSAGEKSPDMLVIDGLVITKSR